MAWPPGSVTSDHRTDEKPGSSLAPSPFLGTSSPEELIKKSEMASLKGEGQVYRGGWQQQKSLQGFMYLLGCLTRKGVFTYSEIAWVCGSITYPVGLLMLMASRMPTPCGFTTNISIF